jgi:hypothetical protein
VTMPPRITYIEKSRVLDDSGTLTIPLNINEPISQIELHWAADNGATNNQANYLHDLVSSCELVDGSEVLWSLPMVKGQALNFFEMGKLPLMNMTEWADDGNREAVWMNFGRHRMDRELALIPSRFKNPQLKVAWDLTKVRACGADGYDTGSGRLTVLAHVLPEAAGARGWLMPKEVYSFTSASSGDEPVDLPLDYPYRLLTVRSIESAKDFRENISNLKLSIDQDKLIPFDLETFRLQELNRDWFGLAMEGIKFDRAHGDVPVIHINELDTIQLMSDEAAAVPYVGYAWSSMFGLNLLDIAGGGAHSGDSEIRYFGWGYTPHNTVAWPFGDMDDIASWFDPTPYRSVRLKLTQIESGAAVSVCLQQYRRY